MLPLTAEQLHRWSSRFLQPFTDVRFARRRLKVLTDARLVRRWPLAIATDVGGAPFYYKLTPQAHRLLWGDDIAFPRKRAFAPIGVARHYHTLNLTDFVIHTAVAAHRAGIGFVDFSPENAYPIRIGEETIWPDGRFTLQTAQGQRIYTIELDQSTESIMSPRDSDSIGRKIRLIDDDQVGKAVDDPTRYCTIFVSTRSRQRLTNILHAASEIVRNPHRLMFCGVYLPDFLSDSHAVTSACLLDQLDQPFALAPAELLSQPQHRRQQVATAVGV
jgi:hypothetical protein